MSGEARLSPQETAFVLAERARALTIPVASARDADALELIVFELDEERYAIETRFAVEVIAGADVAFLPGAEPPLLGITAWRGEMLALLDLRRILGIRDAAAAESAQLLVLGEERPAFGVLVDAVSEIRALPASAIVPLPGREGAGRGFLRGATTDAVLLLVGRDLIHSHGRGVVS